MKNNYYLRENGLIVLQNNFTMKKIFLTVAAIVISATTLAAKDTVPASIKVMSFNIRNSNGKDGTNSWMYRAPAVGYMLEDQAADIFGLQEALPDQWAFLDEGLDDYKSVGVGRDDGRKEGESMRIYYNTKKISMIKWGSFWLSETPEKPLKGWDAACRRTATWALVKDKKSGKKFYFVDTHVDHRGVVAQEKGIKLIVDKMKAINDEELPIIIVGDFNVTPDNPCLSPMREYAKNARETAVKTDDIQSFNDWGKRSEQIDYIWYRGFGSCTEFETVTKTYLERTYVSDHYPIKAILFF